MSRQGWSLARWRPRTLHPVAWWLWALALAVAASRTTNPLLLALMCAVVSWVVLARRSDAPWAGAFRLYVIAGVAVVAIRVFFRIIFGGGEGSHVLIPLPEIGLPALAAGIQLFGDVTAEAVLGGLYDGMRLATMLICIGAANALANPRRLLRSMPPALHEVSTAVVIALSVFPQLAESVVRVTRARRLRLRPNENRIAAMRSVVVPVLEDALDRSLLLASSMDSRGYGRRGDRSRRAGQAIGGLLVVGLMGMCVGAYALLDTTTPRFLATPTLVVAVLVGVVGVSLSGRGVRRSSYRPDGWGAAELATVASGFAAAALVVAAGASHPEVLNPSVTPLMWPQLSLLAVLGVLLGLLAVVVTPPAPDVDGGLTDERLQLAVP